MGISIREVTEPHHLKRFVKFPMKLYKDNPYFVPPLISEELKTLDRSQNPVFKNAESIYFLAYDKGKLVGRIAAMINWKEVNEQKKRKLRFGWFDFVDDLEVSAKLLEHVMDFGRYKQMEWIEGPVGFSNLDKAGLLVEGFDKLPTIVTWYNAPYYEKHLLHHGFQKASEWIEFELKVPEALPEKVNKFSDLVMERYDLRIKKFKNKDELREVVKPMFQLLDKTYGHLSSYVPFKPEQIRNYEEKYINLINKDFVSVLEDADKNLVAFAITMPSYSKALQKAGGKLFPFGWYHLMQANRKNDSAAFYLIGIDPQYQGKGVTAIIFREMFDTFRKYGIKYLETNPELEENKNVQALWRNYEPVLHKRRRSYRKDL
ncbi:MAG: GNAT family N-acetyltransferase [Weeksellaceae bacterium]|nr:GNAT family N-acetyltransferase [Weeksellaceae bacterium]